MSHGAAGKGAFHPASRCLHCLSSGSTTISIFCCDLLPQRLGSGTTRGIRSLTPNKVMPHVHNILYTASAYELFI